MRKNFCLKNKGFTLIELVVVVVLLGILAAFALPRYQTISGHAHTAVVQSTAGAFSSGLSMARAQWELAKDKTTYIDINGDGKPDTEFNTQGYPIGISADGVNLLSEIKDGGVSGNDTCSEIMHNLVKTNGMTIIPADEKGKCFNGDFCAKAINENNCAYVYRRTNETIMYNSKSGEVSYP